jgi:DNA polymerase-3 subunit gamma/tau
MRDALSLLDQAIAYGAGKVEETSVREMLGAVDRSYLFSLLKALANGQGPALLGEAERMAARSLSFDAALQELATLLHRVALAQTLPEALADDEPERDTLLELAGAFSEEDVQLLYQIAIHGRRDLGLAPDEFAGFTMTLMRMLAFVPVEPGNSALAATPVTGRPASKAAASAGTAAATGTQEATGKASVNAEQELADWRTLVGRIKVGGMARMLADNCEFRSFDGDRLELAVPEAHKHLLEKVYTDKLQAALAEYFGRKLRLRISTGGTGNTPAEIENQERQAKLAKAIESIDTDPFVRELVENFDAQVKDSSIKPIQ